MNPLAESKTRAFANLPVIVMSAAADPREFKVKPEAVDVAVRGSPDIVDGLAEKEIHVTVDLTDIESARDLRKRVDVSAPPGVTVIKIAPPLVDVVVPPKR
jgi:YbbR domain-containing protein